MLSFGIIDDGVGIFPTLYKLKQVVSANYICQIFDDKPFAEMSPMQIYKAALDAVEQFASARCDAVVVSSVTVSTLCCKLLSQSSPLPVYYSDAPVLHAATYTASGVLVCGDERVVGRQNLPNLIPCAMDGFSYLAEQSNERAIVDYISQCVSFYDGSFDCIALANSSMNLYKHCFSRVCPNVQIFDSLDGVARKIRKKFKKFAKEESTCRIINRRGEDIGKKYDIFLE